MAVYTSFRIVVYCNIGGYNYLGMCLGWWKEEMQTEFCWGSRTLMMKGMRGKHKDRYM
jgi:hypothetical protein